MYIYCYGHNGRKDAIINELNKLQEHNSLISLPQHKKKQILCAYSRHDDI